MPDRLIRDRARRSPTLQGLSDAAERAWWRLTVTVDDHGRFEADPALLLTELFKRRPAGWTVAKMARCLEEWRAAELVQVYQVPDDDRSYCRMMTWGRHQRPPRLAARFPDPPTDPTVPTERTVHDALFDRLRALREFCGHTLTAVDRNVRIGNGFADLVLTTATLRIVVELKRTRADTGTLRQVVGYVMRCRGETTGVIIATGLGPNLAISHLRAAKIALIQYGPDGKTNLVNGTEWIDTCENVLIDMKPPDLAEKQGTRDEKREARDEKREARDEKREARDEKRGTTNVMSAHADRQTPEDAANAQWGTPAALVALYNAETADECPAVQKLTPARAAKAAEYLRHFPEEDFWRQAFAASKTSRFLRGLNNTPGQGHDHFVASFDWFLSVGKDGAENAVKCYEGKYRG